MTRLRIPEGLGEHMPAGVYESSTSVPQEANPWLCEPPLSEAINLGTPGAVFATLASSARRRERAAGEGHGQCLLCGSRSSLPPSLHCADHKPYGRFDRLYHFAASLPSLSAVTGGAPSSSAVAGTPWSP